MSNKKTLLTENTIRRFMKLASIAPLTETFVDKIKEEEETELEETKEEENLEEAEESTDEELAEGGLDMAYKNDDEMGEEEMAMEPEMDMEPEMEMEPEADAGDAPTSLMNKIQSAVEEVAEQFGVDLGMEIEADGEEMELPAEEAPEDLELGMEEEPALEEETESTPEVEELNEDDLLEKITQKVAARLQQEQGLKEEDAADVDAEELKEAKINKLTDVIVERIFSSLKK